MGGNIVIKPPQSHMTVFLAGSIEMGAAENWQEKCERVLKDWIILNPRRDDWDSSWEQKIENDQFREQVEWELRGIYKADRIIVYFDPNTKSPITLMELGLIAGIKPVQALVVCPKEFYRKGNVDVICKELGVPQFNTLDAALSVLAAASPSKEANLDKGSNEN